MLEMNGSLITKVVEMEKEMQMKNVMMETEKVEMVVQ